MVKTDSLIRDLARLSGDEQRRQAAALSNATDTGNEGHCRRLLSASDC